MCMSELHNPNRLSLPYIHLWDVALRPRTGPSGCIWCWSTSAGRVLAWRSAPAASHPVFDATRA